MTSSSAASRKVTLISSISALFFQFYVFLVQFASFFVEFRSIYYIFQNLSKIACNRLQKELVEWQVNPPAGFKHKVTDNLQRYQSDSSNSTLDYFPKPPNFQFLPPSYLWVLQSCFVFFQFVFFFTLCCCFLFNF